MNQGPARNLFSLFLIFSPFLVFFFFRIFFQKKFRRKFVFRKKFLQLFFLSFSFGNKFLLRFFSQKNFFLLTDIISAGPWLWMQKQFRQSAFSFVLFAVCSHNDTSSSSDSELTVLFCVARSVYMRVFSICVWIWGQSRIQNDVFCVVWFDWGGGLCRLSSAF